MTILRRMLLAAACLSFGPTIAGAAPASLPDRPAAATALVQTVQYGGPGFDGPYGGPPGPYGGPYGGGPYGSPGYGGPPPGLMGGSGWGGEPSFRRHRYRDEPSGYAQRVTYHGFRIELQGGNPEEVAAVEHQIDIVDSVGLSMSNLGLFRSLPIRVVNGLGGGGGGGGGHYSGGSTVTVGNLVVSDNRPVLLHEYMHVMHHRHFAGGFHNATIRGFFREAQERGLYEPGAYMMSNPGEFFAVTASCYLYGTVAREPYNRETIRERQPDYYAYLERLFGPAGTSHVSSARSPAIMAKPTAARGSDVAALR